MRRYGLPTHGTPRRLTGRYERGSPPSVSPTREAAFATLNAEVDVLRAEAKACGLTQATDSLAPWLALFGIDGLSWWATRVWGSASPSYRSWRAHVDYQLWAPRWVPGIVLTQLPKATQERLLHTVARRREYQDLIVVAQAFGVEAVRAVLAELWRVGP